MFRRQKEMPPVPQAEQATDSTTVSPALDTAPSVISRRKAIGAIAVGTVAGAAAGVEAVRQIENAINNNPAVRFGKNVAQDVGKVEQKAGQVETVVRHDVVAVGSEAERLTAEAWKQAYTDLQAANTGFHKGLTEALDIFTSGTSSLEGFFAARSRTLTELSANMGEKSPVHEAASTLIDTVFASSDLVPLLNEGVSWVDGKLQAIDGVWGIGEVTQGLQVVLGKFSGALTSVTTLEDSVKQHMISFIDEKMRQSLEFEAKTFGTLANVSGEANKLVSGIVTSQAEAKKREAAIDRALQEQLAKIHPVHDPENPNWTGNTITPATSHPQSSK